MKIRCQIVTIFIFIGYMIYPATTFAQKRIRIACVGNSITYGATVENREQNCYPVQLSSMLGESYDVRNFGHNGATLLCKGDLPYLNTEQYRSALAFSPDLVFIKLGTNDTKPQNRIYLNEYIHDYKRLITSFKELPSRPRVVLLVPVPVFLTDTTGITSSILTDNIIPKIRQIAYETDCEIVNLYNLFIASPEMLPDKIHPNIAGATVIARRLYEFIKMKEETSLDWQEVLTGNITPFNFYGFKGYDFLFQDRNAKIVIPKKTVLGRPWVWRARFWGHEPQTDIALLERGFHIVYCDVSELFGNDQSISIWNNFYEMLHGAGLSSKAVMEGMSRGGMYVYRWLASNPDRVVAVYADAPVLDMKSWPGGKGRGKGSPEDWEIFKKNFELKTEEEAIAFKGNPLDMAAQIALTEIPLLHVVGDADDVVPVDENTALFERKILESGGYMKVIHKPGIGHHPHSLPNPQPIVDFILRAAELDNR